MVRRILLTGRGSIAQRHRRWISELLPGVQVGVVSALGHVAETLSPCQVFPTFEAGLNWLPDAVVIASASHKHALELEACLLGRLPCLVEKPLVIRRSELERLRALYASLPAPVPVVVGCNLRYLPIVHKMKAEIGSGRLGRLVRAHLEVGQDLRQWRPARELVGTYSADPQQGGGVLYDLVHEIDMASWLLGPLAPVASVGGHLSGLPIAAQDVNVGLLKTSSGAPVTVSLDYVSQQAVRRYVLVLEKATLDCDVIGRQLLYKGAPADLDVEKESISADFDVSATYRLQMQDWLAAISSSSHVPVSSLHEAFVSADLMLTLRDLSS